MEKVCPPPSLPPRLGLGLISLCQKNKKITISNLLISNKLIFALDFKTFESSGSRLEHLIGKWYVEFQAKLRNEQYEVRLQTSPSSTLGESLSPARVHCRFWLLLGSPQTHPRMPLSSSIFAQNSLFWVLTVSLARTKIFNFKRLLYSKY
jgi:hypothetical protein